MQHIAAIAACITLLVALIGLLAVSIWGWASGSKNGTQEAIEKGVQAVARAREATPVIREKTNSAFARVVGRRADEINTGVYNILPPTPDLLDEKKA